MRKLKMILASTTMFVSLSMQAYGQVIESKYFELDLSQWELVDSTRVLYTPTEFLSEADTYFENIVEYLGSSYINKPLKKIVIRIVPGGLGASGNFRNSIYIGVDLLNEGYSIIPHELTHALIYYDSIPSYGEGLACSIQDMFVIPEKQLWYQRGSIHGIVRVIWEHSFDLSRLQLVVDGYQDSMWSFFESQSLVQYLIDRFGIYLVLKYCDGAGYKTHYDVFGVAKEEIMSDWIEFVKKSEMEVEWMERWDSFNSYFSKANKKYYLAP